MLRECRRRIIPTLNVTVQKGATAAKDQPDHKDLLAHKVPKVPPVRMGLRDHKASKDLLAPLEALLVPLDLLGHKDLLVHKVPKVPLVRMGLRDQPVLPVLWDLKDQPDLKGLRGLSVLRDPLGPQRPSRRRW